MHQSRNIIQEDDDDEYLGDVGNEKQLQSHKSYADSIDAYLQFDGEVVERKANASWMM